MAAVPVELSDDELKQLFPKVYYGLKSKIRRVSPSNVKIPLLKSMITISAHLHAKGSNAGLNVDFLNVSKNKIERMKNEELSCHLLRLHNFFTKLQKSDQRFTSRRSDQTSVKLLRNTNEIILAAKEKWIDDMKKKKKKKEKENEFLTKSGNLPAGFEIDISKRCPDP